MESNITAPAYGASSGLVSTLNVFKYGRNENGNGKESALDIGEMTGNAYLRRVWLWSPVLVQNTRRENA